MVPEHSVLRVDEWQSRLCSAGAAVVYEHDRMFEGKEQQCHVFREGRYGVWTVDEKMAGRLDDLGVEMKTERGEDAWNAV